MVESTKSAKQVWHVYRQVVDHVVSSLRPVFQDENTDEAVLEELQGLWIRKLLARGTVVRPSTTSGAAAYPHGHGQADGNASEDEDEDADDGNDEAALPTLVVQRMFVPPPADTADAADTAAAAASASANASKPREMRRMPKPSAHLLIPQVDGGDDKDEYITDDDDDDDKKSSLNSDDDDNNSANEDDMENYIISQFDKIFRSKKRWKANLRDGIMQIDGTDLLFSRAAGEWDW